MAASPDPCLDGLNDASYQGIGFFVETDSGTYGRRVAEHEYPMRDTPFMEDLGEKNSDFTVKGYLFGNSAIGVKNAMVSAARARGPGILILPAESAMMVRLISLTVQRSRDKLGWFDLDFKFKRDEGATSTNPVAVFERLLSSTLGSLIAPLTSFTNALFTVTNVLPFVVSNSIGRVQAFASEVITTGTAYAMSPNAASTINTATDNLLNDTSNAVASMDPLALAFTNGWPAGIVPTVSSIFGTLADDLAPADAMAAILPFCTFAVAEAPAQSASVSDTADANNALAFDTTVRVLALTAYSQAVAAFSYPTRAGAIQARADVVEMFNNEMINLGISEMAESAAEDSRNLIVKCLSSEIATLKPIVIVSAPQTLPSLYWAHRLYGVTTGVEDIEGNASSLVDLNAIADPAFFPDSFEAISPT